MSHAAIVDLEREIGAAFRLALENERLQAEVLAQLHDLRASRTRIVETGDAERRRLERDLHDGAQQRLLALSYDLRVARAAAEAEGDIETASLLAEATGDTQAALGELRELAHGIYPGDPRPKLALRPRSRRSPTTAPLPVEIGEAAGERYPAAGRDDGLPASSPRRSTTRRGGARATSPSTRRSDEDRLVVEVRGRRRGAHLDADPPGRPRRRARRPLEVEATRAAGGDPVRVVVADDVMLTREGIVRLLQDAGVDVVAQAEDADGLLRHVRARAAGRGDRRHPHAADAHRRGPRRRRSEIRAEHPDVGVLVLSQYVEPSYAMRLLEEHPERVGYLLKERVFDVAILVDALRRIADGETVIDPTIVSRLVGRRRREDPLAELTEREREVLGLVAEGLSNRRSPPGSSSPSAPSRPTSSRSSSSSASTNPESHRRVLAVLAYLRAGAGTGAG